MEMLHAFDHDLCSHFAEIVAELANANPRLASIVPSDVLSSERIDLLPTFSDLSRLVHAAMFTRGGARNVPNVELYRRWQGCYADAHSVLLNADDFRDWCEGCRSLESRLQLSTLTTAERLITLRNLISHVRECLRFADRLDLLPEGSHPSWGNPEATITGERVTRPTTSGAANGQGVALYSRFRSPAEWRLVFAHLNGGKEYSAKGWQGLRDGELSAFIGDGGTPKRVRIRLDCPLLPPDFDDAKRYGTALEPALPGI